MLRVIRPYSAAYRRNLSAQLYGEGARGPVLLKLSAAVLSFPRMPVDLRSKQLTLTSTILPGCPKSTSPGVTTYPSANFDRLDRVVVETPNVRSMLAVAEKLRRRDAKDVQINMASELSTATIALAAKFGATQVEPGHAFTGTSPLQIFANVPERQAMIYLSEVSHAAAGGSFFGGGL